MVHCHGALDSLEQALQGVEARKRCKFKNTLALQVERLANGQRFSKEHFRDEADLPVNPLTGKRDKFWALKRIPVRGYCWKSARHTNTWFISHYVHKDYNKLKKKDIEKVHNNWRNVEGS